MLIVTHIPKTGSSSFFQYLQGVFGPRLFHDHRGPRQAPLFWVLRLLRRTGNARLNRLLRRVLVDDRRVPTGMACISGHFLATKYDRAFPDAQHAVWLRDPVERVVSNYDYLRRIADRCNPYCRLIMDENLSLAGFAALPRMRNRQAHYLDGKSPTSFQFIGLTEHFSAGLELAARIFNWSPPSQVPRLNCNASRQGQRYNLDSGLREYIRRLNPQDEQLYQEGRERFRALCQTFDLRFREPARGELLTA